MLGADIPHASLSLQDCLVRLDVLDDMHGSALFHCEQKKWGA
jgi:hypothetical protein